LPVQRQRLACLPLQRAPRYRFRCSHAFCYEMWYFRAFLGVETMIAVGSH
jgi:hypothetical protein